MKKRDRTGELIEKAKAYIEHKSNNDGGKAARQSVYNIYITFIKKAFGLEEKKIKTGVYTTKLWDFTPDSDFKKGLLSASRIASILIKYRRALQTLGAIHNKFDSTLEEAKKILLDAGVDRELVNGLKTSIKPETLEERIKIIKRMYPVGYSSGAGSMVRQALAGIRMYHPIYYRLAGAVSFVKSISNEKQKIKLKEKHDKKTIINPEFLINKANQVICDESSSWVELTVALCAVTGRRPTEIMKTAKFSVNENTPDNYVLFSGVLKSRDRKYEDGFGEWDIPVFSSPEMVIKGLSRLRRKLKEYEQERQDKGGKGNCWTGGYLRYTNSHGEAVEVSIFDKQLINDVDHNQAINQQYNGLLNDALRRWFNSAAVEMKTLRAVYTKMVWEREKDNSTETYDSMTTRVLCYSQSSISEAVKHYSAIEISDKVKAIATSDDMDKKAFISNSDLVKLLNEADSSIAMRSLRAPALARVHKWAKGKAAQGLPFNDLTVTYIRKHCLAGGKKINANTAKLYLELIGVIDADK